MIGNRAQRARRTRARLLGTAGWELVHVAIDDARRLADIEVLREGKLTTAVGLLSRAVAPRLNGIKSQLLITDNGSADRSTAHAIARRSPGIRHLRARPYRRQANGKASGSSTPARRLGLRGDPSRQDRTQPLLAGWLDFYNRADRTAPFSRKTPIARLDELKNLLGFYS